jgi:hypothetical protein
MIWMLRSNILLAVLVGVLFLPIVRYAAFTISYGILESGVLWR